MAGPEDVAVPSTRTMIAAKVSLLIAIAIPPFDSATYTTAVDQEQSRGRRALAPLLRHKVSPVGG